MTTRRSTEKPAKETASPNDQHPTLPEGEATSSTPKSNRGGGPRSKEGRERVSVNALKHGFRSTRPVLPGEDPSQWRSHLNQFLASYPAANYAEKCFIHDLALAEHKLWKIDEYEQGLLHNQLEAIGALENKATDMTDEDARWADSDPAAALLVLDNWQGSADEDELDLAAVSELLVLLPDLLRNCAQKLTVKEFEALKLRGELLLLRGPACLQFRGLRWFFEFLARLANEPISEMVTAAKTILEPVAAGQFAQILNRLDTAEYLRRTAQVVNDETRQKGIERNRTHWERSRDRAWARYEASVRARNG
jgi:hypothetical protein